MRKIHHTPAAVAGVLVLGMLIAGCGAAGGDDASVRPTKTDAPPAVNDCNVVGKPDPDITPVPDPPQELIDAAVKEGTVEWYTSLQQDAYSAWVAAFEKKYPGVKVNVSEGSAGDLSNKFLANAKAGNQQADVVFIPYDEGFWKTGFEDGYMAKLDDVIEGLTDVWPADDLIDIGGGQAMVYMKKANGLAYNTDLVDEADAPKTWEDLLDPRWAGQIIITDPNANVSYAGTFNFLLNYLGEDDFKKLGDNIRKTPLYPGISPGGQALAGGAAEVMVNIGDSVAVPLVADGAPIKLVIPPTTTGPMFAMTVAADAPHPSAAALLLHWLTSYEGQWAIGCSQVGATAAFPQLMPVEDWVAPNAAEAVANLPKINELLGIQAP